MKLTKCANCGKKVKETNYEIYVTSGYKTSSNTVYCCDKKCDEMYRKEKICKKCHNYATSCLNYIPEKNYMLCTESGNSGISCYEEYIREKDDTIRCLFCLSNKVYLSEFSINQDTNRYYCCRNCYDCHDEMIDVMKNIENNECIFCKKMLNKDNIKHIKRFTACNNCAIIYNTANYIENLDICCEYGTNIKEYFNRSFPDYFS